MSPEIVASANWGFGERSSIVAGSGVNVLEGVVCLENYCTVSDL